LNQGHKTDFKFPLRFRGLVLIGWINIAANECSAALKGILLVICALKLTLLYGANWTLIFFLPVIDFERNQGNGLQLRSSCVRAITFLNGNVTESVYDHIEMSLNFLQVSNTGFRLSNMILSKI
jgi:hypothetical protein